MLILLAGFCLCSLATAQRTLETYNVNSNQISVSGISSGACMATQVHVAYSSKMSGVGLVAGAPYYCSEGVVMQSLRCMDTPSSIDPDYLAQQAQQFATNNEIDPTNNLSGDRVYIFQGSQDTTVVPGVGPKVADFYRNFISGINIREVTNIAAEHGFPTEDRGEPCSVVDHDFYINRCSYEASYELLDWIYGGLQRPGSSVPLNGDFYEFNQRDFFSGSTPGQNSMDTSGYVYVPSGCVNKLSPCKLHVALHGCSMAKEVNGDDFAMRSGYSQVGELNDIIILYPQAIASLSHGNGFGCWDWWGYADPVTQPGLFVKRNGNQVLPISLMVDRVAGL